jgi:hypothetical protein
MQWSFPVAVTLHNGEEALFMPGWVAAHSSQTPVHPKPGLIWGGLIVVTLAAFAVTVMSSRRGRQSLWIYLWFGGVSTMLINVFVPHVPATLFFGQYTPGVVTAVFINLPLMSLLLYKAVRNDWVSGARAVRYAVLVPLAVAGSILGLFRFA